MTMAPPSPLLNNAGSAANPTGLLIQNLRLGAKGIQQSGRSLAISTTGTVVTISWTTAAGLKLFSTPSLTAPNWTAVTEGVVVNGDQSAVRVEATDKARFFRLQQ